MFNIHRVSAPVFFNRPLLRGNVAFITAFVLALLPLSLSGCLGAQGSESTQNARGIHGNVNVQSLTLTLSQAAWQNEETREVVSWPTSQITQDIVEGGAVLVYTDQGTGKDTWTALPFTNPIQGFHATLSYTYEPGSFSLLVTKDTNASLANALSGHRIRVVVIPAEGAFYLGNVEAGEYEKVEAYFGF